MNLKSKTSAAPVVEAVEPDASIHSAAPLSKVGLIAGLGLIALTAVLGLIVRHSSGILQNEFRLNQRMYDSASALLDWFALTFNFVFGPIGSVVLLIIGAVITYRIWHSWYGALRFVVTAGLGSVLAALFKLLFQEPRPALLGLCPDVAAVPAVCPWLITETGTNAFPSGHTAVTTSLVLALIVVTLRVPTARLIALVIGALLVFGVAWSRMYLGVHYLTDVIGGALISVGTVLVLQWFWASRDIRSDRDIP